MKIHLKMAVALLPAILFSCSENMPGPKTYPDYGQLAVGNYWIYEKYSIDSLGNETNLNSLDSVYIEKDTLINGNVYYKMIEPEFAQYSPTVFFVPRKVTYIRDSLDCIITSTHSTIFSSEQIGTTLQTSYFGGSQDTHYVETSMMADPNLSITVPAGTFITITYLRTIDPYPAWEQAIGGTILFRTRYAENVGIITKNLPINYGQTSRLERRLLRYHLN